MDAVAAVLFAAALVMSFVSGCFFGYSKGAIDGFRDGYASGRPKPPKRGPGGRFIKE